MVTLVSTQFLVAIVEVVLRRLIIDLLAETATEGIVAELERGISVCGAGEAGECVVAVAPVVFGGLVAIEVVGKVGLSEGE